MKQQFMCGVVLAALTAALAIPVPAQAVPLFIDFGVVPIGASPSANPEPLQSLSSFNLGGGTDVVNIVAPGDSSGLSVDNTVSINPQVINLLSFSPIVKSWGSFTEDLTSIGSVNRTSVNAIGFTLVGVINGPGFANAPIQLIFGADQAGGPGNSINWSLTNITTSPTPLPGALVLFGSVLAGAGALLRRRRTA